MRIPEKLMALETLSLTVPYATARYVEQIAQRVGMPVEMLLTMGLFALADFSWKGDLNTPPTDAEILELKRKIIKHIEKLRCIAQEAGL